MCYNYKYLVCQGLKWLAKSGGASSNMAATAGGAPPQPAAPSILPKGGGVIALPAPPTVTPLQSIKSNLGGYLGPPYLP